MEKKKYQLSFQLNVPPSKKEKVEYKPRPKQELDQGLDQKLGLEQHLEQKLDHELDHEQQTQVRGGEGISAKHSEPDHLLDGGLRPDYKRLRSDSIEQDRRWHEEKLEGTKEEIKEETKEETKEERNAEVKEEKSLRQWDFQDTEPLIIDDRQEDHNEDPWNEKEELIPYRNRTHSYSYRPPYRSIQSAQDVAWQREEDEPKASYMEGTPLSYRVTKRKNWKTGVKKSTRLFLVASSAIIVGLILGIAVLNIFSNLAEEPNQAEASPIGTSSPTLQERLEAQGAQGNPSDAMGQSSAQSSKGVETLDPSAPPATAGTGELQWPSRTYYFVQAGAFSSSQAAQVMLQEYKDQGYPGTMLEQGNSFHLFVGVSGTKEEAQSLSQYYEEQGMESYVKELSFPQVSFSSNGQESQWELFASLLGTGDQLVTLLSRFASQGLKEGQYEITAEEWKSLQELHKDYLHTEKRVWGDWEGRERQTGEEMNKQLSTAVNAIETYRQQKHRSFLWQSQQALLHYVQAYYELIQAKIG